MHNSTRLLVIDVDEEICKVLDNLQPQPLTLYVAAASGVSAISANENLPLIIAFFSVRLETSLNCLQTKHLNRWQEAFVTQIPTGVVRRIGSDGAGRRPIAIIGNDFQ